MVALRPLLMLALAPSACASQPVEPYVRPAPEYALPAKADADIEADVRSAHGPEASGFEPLDRNEDGLRWRLALIDSAKHCSVVLRSRKVNVGQTPRRKCLKRPGRGRIIASASTGGGRAMGPRDT